MDDVTEFGKPIRRVTHLNPVDSYLTGSWEALGAGAPVLVALAQLCAQAMVDVDQSPPDNLSNEAKAILVAARERGVIEVKGVNTAFEAPSRMLAVYVEMSEEKTIAFRDQQRPEITVRFLEGFRQLCRCGLILHHIYRDFSLTQAGFAFAQTIPQEEIQPWLDMGTEFGLHD